MRWSIRGKAITIVVLSVFHAVATGATAASVSRSFTWSLRTMGYRDQEITQDKTSKTWEYKYRLPAGGEQGKPYWYRVKLHYRLEISKNSGPGTIYLWASTNGRGAASIEFNVRKEHGRIGVRGNDLGMISGSRRWTQKGLTREGAFENFLQNTGVRGGKNTLEFAYFVTGEARFKEWRVYDDSGIVRSRTGPAKITLTPFLEKKHISVGERFAVRYEIRNTSRMPLPPGGEVSVGTASNRTLRVIGASSKHVDRIPGLGRETGSFVLKAMKAGSAPVTIQASSWGGSPSIRIVVRVLTERPVNSSSAEDRASSSSTGALSQGADGKGQNGPAMLSADQRSRALSLAENDAGIRRVLGDVPARAIDAVPWSEDGTERTVFGANVTMKLDHPATLEGDWVFVEFSERRGYRLVKPVHYRVNRVTELEAYVDFTKNEVVAFGPLDGHAVRSSIRPVSASTRSGSSRMPVWEMILLGLGSAVALSVVAWFARRVVVSRRVG
jgi:hypothetical protein